MTPSHPQAARQRLRALTMTVGDLAAVAMPGGGGRVVVIAGSTTLCSRTIDSGRQSSARVMCSARSR
jgi:hypothetical protein